MFCCCYSESAKWNPDAFYQAELAECLERDGFKSVQEAVGADCK